MISLVCLTNAFSQTPDIKTIPNEPQDLDLFLPKQPPNMEPGEIIEKEELKTSSQPDQAHPIIPSLQGIICLGDIDDFKPEGISKKGIHIKNVPALNKPEFHNKIAPFIGKPTSLNDLNNIAREIVLFLKEQDYPIVDAIVAEQNIATGTVQIIVFIGKLGKLSTENNQYFSQESILSNIRINLGERIHGLSLMEDLRWINQNPFRKVDLIYTEGSELGETDIILRTIDRRPIRFYGSYENSGTHLTGFDRWIAGINWGNAFGLDHLMNYQFTTSKNSEHLQAHSLSYFIPLPWRHKLWVFGSYSLSNANLPSPLALEGESWRISGRYIIPFKKILNYKHELTIGLDFIESNNDLLFAGTNISDTPTHVFQSLLAYNGSLPDRYGSTAVNISLHTSPGNISSRNRDEAFQRSRANTQAQYFYTRAEIERTTYLPERFAWIMKLQGQWTNKNLLASEQFSLGGYNTLRGYEMNEVNVDRGFIMNHELHAPPFKFLSRFRNTIPKDSLVFLFFWDYAVGSNHTRVAGEDAHIILSSIGPGLHYNAGPHLNLRLHWGFQLKDSGNSPTGNNSRLEVGATFSY